MQITVATSDDRVITVEMDGDDSIDTLKAIVEAETGIPAAQQQVVHNGTPLLPGKTISQHGVQSGDLIMVMVAPSRPAVPAAGAPSRAGAAAANNSTAMNPDGSAANPEFLMSTLRSSPAMSQLPPPLAEAIRNNDIPKFQEELRKIAAERLKAQEEEERFLRLAESDPFNPEVQRRLEEAIQQKNVAENFEQAIEHNPEAFATVTMLYIKMEVNGHPMKAFIDSGAQSTIMSKSCAERCGLLRLLDTRFQGTAVGVGSAKILGRIHMCPAKAGGMYMPLTITVLEQDGMEFLFGLDNLKRHQCCIDLKANMLRFGSSDVSLPFLAEHEIPKSELFPGGANSPAKPSLSSGGGGGSQQQQQLVPGGGPSAVVPTVSGGGGPAVSSGGGGQGGGAIPAGWEEKIQRLCALGFGREQCLGALRAAQGNEEVAGSLLFSAF